MTRPRPDGSDPVGRSAPVDPDGPAAGPDADTIEPAIPGPVLERLVTFLERTSDLVGVTDDKGTVVYLNRAARIRLGLRDDATEPVTTADLFPQEGFDIYFDQIRPRIIGGDVWTGYVPIRGSMEQLDMWATVVGDTKPGGEVSWMVLTARDINDWRHAPEAHQRLAAYDELTGLASRSLLLDHIAKARNRSTRTGRAVAVAFIDLDDMRAVNHTFGSAVGDAVLVEVAGRIRDSVRVIDTVARVGGDQFVVLFDGVTDEREIATLVTHIDAHLEGAAVEVLGRSINVSASIGTAMAREGEIGDHLLGRADTAMYEVKADRRTQSGRPAPSVGPDLRSVTLKDVAVAVTRHDIVPYYQRVIRAEDGATSGVQALARWLRPEGPAVDAAQFLTIAEDSGVSFSLDLAILRDAAAALAHRPELGRLYVSVSPRFLRHPGVDRFVHEVLMRSSLDPHRLAMLIPERVVASDGFLIGDTIASVSDLGVGLVLDLQPLSGDRPDGLGPARTRADRHIDDLGSSFIAVRLAPAWTQLITDAPDSIAAIVERAHGLDQQVLAAGVETDEQRVHLVDIGCDLLSGHLIAAPAPIPG